MIELINPYVVKILITAKDGDSIRVISKRTGISYAWTYNWIEKLVDAGIIKRKGQTVKINKNSKIYSEFSEFIKKILMEKISISDAYSLPNLSGLEYAFTFTDAVFIWTKGGYNIGRSMDSYPIFIEVLDAEIKQWFEFFERFSIKATKKIERKKDIYFIIIPKKKIEKEEIENVFVIPLKKTVAYAKKYVYNFEPALEMLNKMYNLKIKIKYAEKEVM